MKSQNKRSIRIGSTEVGDGCPTFVVAEIGINHNGSLEIAKKLIDAAAVAGCDAVKFQKRTPEKCVPKEQQKLMRDTPWGRMTYLEYRHRVEFGEAEYRAIEAHCETAGVQWFASCWDEDAVAFMEEHFHVPCYKVASASLTDHALLRRKQATGRPLIVSTGMSTLDEVDTAMNVLRGEDGSLSNVLITHTNSTYPCPVEDLNLRVIETLRERYPGVPVGYSGHETGLAPTWAAVALGASFVERHVTLDRAMWGSDQAASVEAVGLLRLVSSIRDIERALGDGVKRLYESELPARKKLRRFEVVSDATSHVA